MRTQKTYKARSTLKSVVMFTVFRECLSVSRLKKVRHAGESRHPGAGNRETTGKLDSGVRRNDERRNRIRVDGFGTDAVWLRRRHFPKHHEAGAAVFYAAFFGVLEAGGSFFTVADRHEAVSADALID
jgi:hypothetical protein